jgi:mycofactocin precursor
VLPVFLSDARHGNGALPISAKELFMPVEVLAAPAAVTESTAVDATAEVELVEEDLLVEDVSIDGMCGVY